MNTFFYKIFGASWFTSLLGYIVMLGSGAVLVQEAIALSGLPTDPMGWLSFIIGLALRFTKQSNVSNAEKPLAVAQPVIAAPGATFAVPPQKVMKSLVLFCTALSFLALTACTELDRTNAQTVIVKLQGNIQTALVTGCTHAPTVEVLVSMIVEFLPEGTDKEKLQAGITVAQSQVAAICLKVQTTEAQRMPATLRRGAQLEHQSDRLEP